MTHQLTATNHGEIMILKSIMKTSCCGSNNVSSVNGTLLCLNEHCVNYLSGTSAKGTPVSLKNTLSFILFIFYLLFSFDNFSMKARDTTPVYQHHVEVQSATFSIDGLIGELRKNDVLCADAVLAQMRLESGHFKSFLFRRANNLMGMRYPFNRPTTACGIYLPAGDTIILGTQENLRQYRRISNTYAVYDTWQDAVKDYKHWQDRCFNLNERYLNFLGSVYAEDERYVHKIKQLSTL